MKHPYIILHDLDHFIFGIPGRIVDRLEAWNRHRHEILCASGRHEAGWENGYTDGQLRQIRVCLWCGKDLSVQSDSNIV